jgi:transposase-like protein
MRWVVRYAPEFEKHGRGYEKPVALSWRVDETYLKVGGGWTCLYRAVDQNGKSVDSFLRKRRDVGAAKTLFRRAWKQHGDPLSITLDAYAAWHRAMPEWKESGEILYQKMGVRSCASLHHVVEPDHRRVKRRVNPMLGFQSSENARVVIAGIELAQRSARDYTTCDGGVAPTRATLRCGSG